MVSEKITQLFRSSEHGTVFWAALPVGKKRGVSCYKGKLKKRLKGLPRFIWRLRR